MYVQYISVLYSTCMQFTNTILTRAIFAFLMVISCCAMTDRTSMSILLNSSKQHQAPDWASPEKNLPIIYKEKRGIFVDVVVSIRKYNLYTLHVHTVSIHSNIMCVQNRIF